MVVIRDLDNVDAKSTKNILGLSAILLASY